jgi:alkylation response protein AidB-like acyl-CoA dehydrogenase
MLSPSPTAVDPLLDLSAYATAFEAWLATRPPVLRAAATPTPDFAARVDTMAALMSALFDGGWARYGWPTTHGGLGGSIVHRATMWEALARHGVRGMALFEHLEILAPALVALGRPEVVGPLLPRFLAGEQTWAQGFSEPEAGSDLAALRTRATAADGGYVVSGRKIWTSWAAYARWCLVLARTGSTESRHRGLTAFVVDLRDPGVEVRAIEQANGTDELSEVTFDDVFVPQERIVGTVDGGWAVAMHILSHERGTFAWFRHLFLYQHLLEQVGDGDPSGDRDLGEVLLDLAAVSATSVGGLHVHAAGAILGPRAAITKLLLCEAEQRSYDWIHRIDGDLAAGVQHPEVAALRQEYVFSRIVTVYGGSQQMQLETIAKHVVGLP